MGMNAMAATDTRTGSKEGKESLEEIVMKLSNQIQEMKSQMKGPESTNQKQECKYCKKRQFDNWQTHTEKNCWKLHPDQNPYKKGNSDTGDSATDSYLFALVDQARAVANEAAGHLSVDSCCTTTAVTKNCFGMLTDVRTAKNGHRVQVANGAFMDVDKYGTLSFNVLDSLPNEIVNISIKDVLYVPDLQYSLLSVPQMEKTRNRHPFRD
jgi:hypothetical protein